MTDGIIQQILDKYFDLIQPHDIHQYAQLRQELIAKIKQESFIIDGRIPYVQLHKLIGDTKE